MTNPRYQPSPHERRDGYERRADAMARDAISAARAILTTADIDPDIITALRFDNGEVTITIDAYGVDGPNAAHAALRKRYRKAIRKVAKALATRGYSTTLHCDMSAAPWIEYTCEGTPTPRALPY